MYMYMYNVVHVLYLHVHATLYDVLYMYKLHVHVHMYNTPSFAIQVHGRHIAVPRMVSGAYAQEYGQAVEIDKATQKVQVHCSKICKEAALFIHVQCTLHVCI